MPNAPIPFTNLPPVTLLSGNELVPVVQGGANRTATASQLAFGSTTESITFDNLAVTSSATIEALTVSSNFSALNSSATNLSAVDASFTDLTVSSTATFAAGQVSSDWSVHRLIVTSSANISGLQVLSIASVNSSITNLTVSGSATIPTLAVTSSATIADLSVTDAVDTVNLTVSGSATVPILGVTSSGTIVRLEVTSSANMAAASVSSNFSALNSSFSTLTVSSAASFAKSVTVSSNVTLGSSTATAIFNYTNQTRPNMPAFLALSTANQSNATGNSTAVTVQFGDKVYDRATSYSTTTFAFTAPITGIYALSGAVGLTGMTSNHTAAQVNVVVNSTRVFTPQLVPYTSDMTGLDLGLGWAFSVDISSGQTVVCQALVTGASSGADIIGGSTLAPKTWFGGFLVG